MTIREAVKGFCAIEVPSGTVDVEIINSGLNGDLEYIGAIEKKAAGIAYKVLAGLLPLSSFKEGDLTVQLDREGIKARLKYLSGTYGFTDVTAPAKPTVRDKSYLW